ncbi:MAG: hypothetical protein SFU83_02575 [Meiothermus sp.]|nr:hypothetical protein [Meiothermus sp.]
MQQTFDDLYNEHQRQAGRAVLGFVLRAFIETALGVAQEHLLLVSAGGVIRAVQTLGISALISFLLVLPLMLMQLINRRGLNEEFPLVLFIGFWLAPFAIGLMLLPIARAWRRGTHRRPNGRTAHTSTLLTNPVSSAAISLGLLLFTLMQVWLSAVGWAPLARLLNGPNPEVAYLPGQLITFGFGLLPLAAGVVASRPIVHTLRAGGSLVAHPFHLILVLGLASLLAVGFGLLLVDQWPCFVGVPNCD